MNKHFPRRTTIIVLSMAVVGVVYATSRFLQEGLGNTTSVGGNKEEVTVDTTKENEPAYTVSQTQSTDTSVKVPVADSSKPTSETPKLFTGLNWKPATTEDVIFRTQANKLITIKAYSIESQHLSTCPADFLAYYRDQLTKVDWKETWSADGVDCSSVPGETQFGYEKSAWYFQFGVLHKPDGYVAFVEYARHD